MNEKTSAKILGDKDVAQRYMENSKKRSKASDKYFV
jgi:hypothetical protein